ncbi:hypothetical protein CGLO_08640 [Colletotrichum gloeosporioides Cg-14]|uniref:Uncharacterized protein n=1 Tax=Colletotrichum gloeosporioides (strain Cg-14) TaxID=1237896 RepID=T0KHW0_COLGC|nr:hypothetical protein CGLO_08640 [Colletotrichum gloeosporioides Cg-14]
MLILDHLSLSSQERQLRFSDDAGDSGDSAHDGVHTGDSTLNRPLVANVVEDLNPFHFLLHI